MFEFGLFYGSCQLLVFLDKMPKSFPAIKIVLIISYAAQVMGSSAAITLKGSKVISPVSHSIWTLYLLPSQLGSVALKDLHDQLLI